MLFEEKIKNCTCGCGVDARYASFKPKGRPRKVQAWYIKCDGCGRNMIQVVCVNTPRGIEDAKSELVKKWNASVDSEKQT